MTLAQSRFMPLTDRDMGFTPEAIGGLRSRDGAAFCRMGFAFADGLQVLAIRAPHPLA